MTSTVEVALFEISAVDIKPTGAHGGSAKLTLSRRGFVDQYLYVEPEEGEVVKRLLDKTTTVILKMQLPRDESERPPNAKLIPCS